MRISISCLTALACLLAMEAGTARAVDPLKTSPRQRAAVTTQPTDSYSAPGNTGRLDPASSIYSRDRYAAPQSDSQFPGYQGQTDPFRTEDAQSRMAPQYLNPANPAIPTEQVSKPRWRLGVYSKDTPTGVLVMRVVPGSAAAQAGLEQDDVIVCVSGYQVGLINDIRFDMGQEFNLRANENGLVHLLVQDHRNSSLVPLPVQLEPRTSTVSGNVVWRETSQLPRDAVITVELREIMRPGAPVVPIASKTIARVRGGSTPFELEFDPAEIDPKRSYYVHATIADNYHTYFTTSRAYQVITDGRPRKVEIALEPTSYFGGNTASNPYQNARDAEIEEIVRMFREYLKRDPNSLEMSVYRQDVERGGSVAKAKKDILSNAEFYAQCSGDKREYITKMHELVTGRRPSDAEVRYWMARWDEHNGIQRQVANEFLSSLR